MEGWRIEFLTTASSADVTSGLSRGVWGLGTALGRRGHQVRLLYPDDRPRPALTASGVTEVAVPVGHPRRRPFGRDIAIARQASRLFDPRADVIVGNDEKTGALTCKTHPGSRPVLVMMVHDVALHTFDTLRPLEPNRGIRQRLGNWMDRRTLRRLETRALRGAHVILVGSELNRQLLKQTYGVADARVHLVPHGVPDLPDVGSRQEARPALGLPGEFPVLSFIGRTPDRQGLATALAAFRLVRERLPGTRFLVAGCAVPPEPGLTALGEVDEATKARVLVASDAFLFPARYEGFGLAPREAMRCGVPAILSQHVPLDGVSGDPPARVVGSENPRDYADAVVELLGDPALSRKIGEAGRAYAGRFTYERMAEEFERVVGPLLG